MIFRASHTRKNYDDKTLPIESVVIIHFTNPQLEYVAEAIYVKEDGSLGQDSIANFIITDGAW